MLTYVHRLRASLDDDSIVTLGTAYRFDASVADVDATHFEDLVEEAGAADLTAPSSCTTGPVAVAWDRRSATWPTSGGRSTTSSRLDELRVNATRGPSDGLTVTGERRRGDSRLAGARRGTTRFVSASCVLLAQALAGVGAAGRGAAATASAGGLGLADGTGLDPSTGADGSWSTRSAAGSSTRGASSSWRCAATSSTMRSARGRSEGSTRRRSAARADRSRVKVIRRSWPTRTSSYAASMRRRSSSPASSTAHRAALRLLAGAGWRLPVFRLLAAQCGRRPT